jgi:hypothetical protein
MNTVTMEQAKENLEELVEQAAHGEPFLIRQAAGDLVKITVETAQEEQELASGKRKIGWLDGKFVVPDDIKKPYEQEINAMFYGNE